MTTTKSASLLFIFVAIASAIVLFTAPQFSMARETERGGMGSSTSKVRMAREKSDHSTTTKVVDATCMQTAVDTREDAISSAWEKMSTDLKAALALRKTALHDAWGLSDLKAQKTATVAGWKAWKDASKKAHDEMKKSRKATWDAFKKTTKETCKVITPKDEALGKDASGSISL